MTDAITTRKGQSAGDITGRLLLYLSSTFGRLRKTRPKENERHFGYLLTIYHWDEFMIFNFFILFVLPYLAIRFSAKKGMRDNFYSFTILISLEWIISVGAHSTLWKLYLSNNEKTFSIGQFSLIAKKF